MRAPRIRYGTTAVGAHDDTPAPTIDMPVVALTMVALLVCWSCLRTGNVLTRWGNRLPV